AEDGIRDRIVTGVQTCALPISPVGTLSLLSNGKHALRIDYDDFTSNQEKWTKWTERYIGDVEFHQNSAPFKWIAEELQAYFLGEKKEFTFDFKLIGTS